MLDYEGDQREWNLTITVTDDGVGGQFDPLSTTGKVTIAVANVNEAPEITKDQSFAVYENVSSGHSVGMIVSSDPDNNRIADTQSLVYEDLSSDQVQEKFYIRSDGGVRVAGSLDYESAQSYILNFSVTDNGSPTMSAVGWLTVNVKDVNEAPSVVTTDTFINNLECYLPENSASDAELLNTTDGNGVARVAATDPDSGDSASLRFDVTGGTGASYFGVDASTGTLFKSDSTAMDYEGGTISWTLEVTVTDR